MTTKMSIALAVLALLMPCYLSAPRQPRDTVISCSDGSHLPPTCPLAQPLADCLKGNRNLWLIMCSSRVVQQLAKGVCFNSSKVSGPTPFCVACMQMSSTISSQKSLPPFHSQRATESPSSAIISYPVYNLFAYVCWHLTTGCPSSCPSPSVHRVMTPKLSAVPIPPHSVTQQSIHPVSWCPISPPAWSWGGAWSNWDNRCARPRKLSFCKDAKISMMTAERSFNGQRSSTSVSSKK